MVFRVVVTQCTFNVLRTLYLLSISQTIDLKSYHKGHKLLSFHVILISLYVKEDLSNFGWESATYNWTRLLGHQYLNYKILLNLDNFMPSQPRYFWLNGLESLFIFGYLTREWEKN